MMDDQHTSSEDSHGILRSAFVAIQVGRDGRLCRLLARCLWFLGVPKREATILAGRGASGLLTLFWFSLALATVFVFCLFDIHLAAVVLGMMVTMLMFRQYQEENMSTFRQDRVFQSCRQKISSYGPRKFGVFDGLDPRCRYQKARSQKTHDRNADLLEDDNEDLDWGVLRELERL
ncbi:uncharacterized protein [Panulirus ornatus]|uniref:uncharacterized protein n=1 Tax=Panulirus ornatus TaxID=150431 RepID=UPI003A854821